MKNIFYFILLLTFLNIKLQAQSGIKYFNACNENKNYFAFKGDTIVFRCDSIRLLNTRAFGSLQEAYARLYNTSNQLINKTDSAGLIYKTLYEEKSRDYNSLKSNFEQFRINTQNHILSTDTNILAIKNYTNNAKIELNKTDSLIQSSVKDIKDFKDRMWLTKLKAGAVGFLAATVVLLPIILLK
jgi:hypothetical protein